MFHIIAGCKHKQAEGEFNHKNDVCISECYYLNCPRFDFILLVMAGKRPMCFSPHFIRQFSSWDLTFSTSLLGVDGVSLYLTSS